MNHMQQQNQLEFLKWIPVVGDKHLGIAVIRYERRFIFRFKILSSEHGGYWATTAAFKTGISNGKDKYESAFDLDSSYENELIKDFVISNVNNILNNRANVNQSPSAFGYSSNYGHQHSSFAPQSNNFGSGTQSSFDDINAPTDDNLPF